MGSAGRRNFYAAFQSPALADCTLATFDEPGTGLAAFDPNAGLDVSALADMAQGVADQLRPGPYFLAGASMGGLITLLQMRRHGTGRIKGYINSEGNLSLEDCMFSRRVVSHDLDSFEPEFRRMMGDLGASRYAGDKIIAHNMALNVDIRGYHAYSFETVAESDSGRLLDEFIACRSRACSSTVMPIRASHIYPGFGRVMSGFRRFRRARTPVLRQSGRDVSRCRRFRAHATLEFSREPM
jgi:pimeloyl-ACP methyl ester carboxylesterase